MELCAAKIVEGSGEEGPMERFATESLKAAAKASGPHGNLVGYPTGKKADDEKAVSGLEGTMAKVAAAVASASTVAAAAAKAARHAAVAAAAAAAAARQAGVAAAKQAEAEAELVNQVEEAEDASDNDDDVDSVAEYEPRMSGLEYILAYKELPQYEIDLILKGEVERVPFTDTRRFKLLTADPSVTQDDIDAAAKEHEALLDTRVRFREYVRQEYEAKGYVEVSDEYIARRVKTEEHCKKVWEELFADLDGDSSDEEQEAGEEIDQ